MIKYFNIIPIVFLATIYFKFQNQSSYFSYVIGLVFLYEFINSTNVVKNQVFSIFFNNKLIFISFLISFISTVVNEFFFYTIKIGYILELGVFGLITLLGILLYIKKGEKYVFDGLTGIVIILIIASILGILEYFTGINIFVHTGLMTDDFVKFNTRIASCFVHPIPFANILLLPILFIFMTKTVQKGKYFFLVLLIIALILTESRSGWVGLLVSLFAYFTRVYKLGNIKMSIILTVGLLLCGIFISPLGDIISSRFVHFDEHLSNDYQRTGTIFYMLNIIFNSDVLHILFGNGNHESVNTMLKTVITLDDFQTTDNLYLADLYNYGIIYVVCTIALFLKFIRFAIKSESSLHTVIFYFLISTEVAFFFYEPFIFYPVTFVFFLCLGVSLTYKDENAMNNNTFLIG